MAFLVEVIVNVGVDRGEFLQGLHLSEPEHRPFSSSEWAQQFGTTGGHLFLQNPSRRWRDRIGIKRLLQRHLVWLPLATPRCSVLPQYISNRNHRPMFRTVAYPGLLVK